MTALEHKRLARGFGGWPIFSLSLAALVAGTALPSAAVAGTALPSGGKVTAGAATISASGGAETIDQTSAKAIIDWSSFTLGKGGKVTFDNGSGATLNEVSGGSAAQIQGLLSGTGSVFVIDPAGVVIGRGGVVQTGGTFVAATLAPSTSRFLAGAPMVYAGKSTAQVLNLGKIGSLGGDVALIGLTVANRGQISAAKGDVGLMAGSEVVVRDRLLNDGKFEVVLGGAGTSATNTGTIQAAEAELRANGGNVYALAGNAGGAIDATGVSSNDGKVFLIAGGGTTVAHGQIDATTASGAGGQVETSGHSVNFEGLSVRAGDWLVDPTDLTVNAAAATTISNNLATTNVTLKTTATSASGPGVQNPNGAGDIIIAAPISWSSGETLTLDAYHSITFGNAVTVSGAGKVVLVTNDGGAGGDYGFGLGPNGFAGSLSFTGAPRSGQALTINGAAYTLLYSMADLANINSTGLGGDYALATPLDASGTTYTAPLIGSFSSPFTGDFTGLGHAISNLSISSDSDAVGLFAYASGTIRDIGLVLASVTGGGSGTGGLVGEDSGMVTDSYVTGWVSGFGSSSFGGGYYVGGLAGADSGAITDSYANVSVSTPTMTAGGLVGADSGTITNSYASGPVFALIGGVGGLVGEDSSGTIADSYATGEVTGGGGHYHASLGGLVGYNNGGTITDGYYDADTTGMPVGLQANGSTGLTTAQLQGALPAGFSATVWGTGAGLYPYLISFYPTKPQAISGFAYNSSGSVAKGAQIGLYVGGALLNGETATSGANGYFYELVPGGTVSSSTKLGETIIAVSGSPGSGLTYTDQPTLSSGNVVGLGVTAGAMYQITSAAALSGLNADLASTFGSVLPTIEAQAGGVSDFITATGSGGFTIDQSLDLGRSISIKTSNALTIAGTLDAAGHVLMLDSGGAIDASGGVLEAATLTGSSVGGATLTDAGNAIAVLSKFSNSGSGAFSLTDDEALHVTGPVIDDGNVNLTNTSGGLTITGTIYAQAHTLTLKSTGVISAAKATLKAAVLAGSSVGGATFTNASNLIGNLDRFTNTGSGTFSLTDGKALEVVGPVTDKVGDVTLTTTGGALRVTGKVNATGHTLTLTSSGAIVTTGATLDYKKLVENPNTP